MRKALLAMLLLGIFVLGAGLARGPSPGDVAATAASGNFFDTGQSLGNASSLAVAVGDLDGQNGPDAFTANNGANRVWLNDGSAFFTGNGQSLGSLQSEDVALGDLDGDNDLDAVVANSDGLNRVWENDGSGQFTAGQSFDSNASRGVGLGDLDGDGDLDAFFANNGGNTVWRNAGGVFSDSGQSLGSANGYDVALADVDGDGDLDAFVANGLSGAQPDEVWLNQGGSQGGAEGVFADSGQSIGATWTYAVALGDLGGGPLPDAFAANWFPNANRVFINSSGVFNDSGQSLGNAASLGVALGDVDADGDLDAFVGNNFPGPSAVWLNDGAGAFSDSGQSIAADTTVYDVALADLDGDGDLDAFLANFGPNAVYSNGPPGLPNATFDIDRATNALGQEVYYWAQEGDALLSVVLSALAPQNLDVLLRVDATTVTTDTLSFAAGQQAQPATVDNPGPNPSVEVGLTLFVEQPDNPTDSVLLFFIDGDQGDAGCILCYLEWLGRLVGFTPTFGQLFHLDVSEQRASPQWQYYTGWFDTNSSEMAGIVARHPGLLWDSLNLFDEWTPAVVALDNGSGDQATITQEMVDDAIGVLDEVKAHASPALQRSLEAEMTKLDLPSFAGLTMDEAWVTLQARAPVEQQFLPLMAR